MQILHLLLIPAAVCVLFLQPVIAAEKEAQNAEKEFCRLDKNSDRMITFEEFSACEFYKLEHARQLPYEDPGFAEQNKNRRLSDDELKAFLFDKADVNKDRKIDRKEWEEFYNSIVNSR